MVSIQLDGLTCRFGETVAVNDVTLDFPRGSFTTLLGPSGCGKTTLLRLLAGFETPNEGRILFDGEQVAAAGSFVPPEKRGVGVVFQSYALWPHMDVAGNVAYPLKTRGQPRQAIAARVREVLDIVGLDGFQTRRIEELSGGQRQRVALARCLVADSRVILFDEPLANLDMHLRATMVEAFRDVHHRTGATIVYVTHDQAEALALSDRIAVMSAGKVLQLAEPTKIYRAPADAKVAAFVGRGSILRGMCVETNTASATVEIAGHRFKARARNSTSGPVTVLLRPEGLSLAEQGIPATVLSAIYRGPVYEVRLAVPGGEIVLDCAHAPSTGARLHVTINDAWIVPCP